MAMNRHEEENIMIGDWRHASLIPPLTADEDAASNDGADSKNHPAVYRMIQNEKLDRNLKRHQITGQGSKRESDTARTDIFCRHCALWNNWDWLIYQFGWTPWPVGLGWNHIVILLWWLDCHGRYDVSCGNGLSQASAGSYIRISHALRWSGIRLRGWLCLLVCLMNWLYTLYAYLMKSLARTNWWP